MRSNSLQSYYATYKNKFSVIFPTELFPLKSEEKLNVRLPGLTVSLVNNIHMYDLHKGDEKEKK
jgi:hypothetical protein